LPARGCHAISHSSRPTPEHHGLGSSGERSRELASWAMTSAEKTQTEDFTPVPAPGPSPPRDRTRCPPSSSSLRRPRSIALGTRSLKRGDLSLALSSSAASCRWWTRSRRRRLHRGLVSYRPGQRHLRLQLPNLQIGEPRRKRNNPSALTRNKSRGLPTLRANGTNTARHSGNKGESGTRVNPSPFVLPPAPPVRASRQSSQMKALGPGTGERSHYRS
jgi:hypothetical protein